MTSNGRSRTTDQFVGEASRGKAALAVARKPDYRSGDSGRFLQKPVTKPGRLTSTQADKVVKEYISGRSK